MKNIQEKSLKSYVLTLLVLVGISSMVSAQHIVASYNIRFDNENDIGNLWKDRLPHIIDLVRFHEIELIGTQEGLSHQIKQLSEGLDYSYLGVGRDDGAEQGEYTAILYDGSRLKLLDQGTFWLSPTPEKPSKGWDAALNRICSWGKFEDNNGKTFYVFNAHYDHIGQQAREESSKLVMDKVARINQENAPAILMGDFNVTPENTAYLTITSNPDWQDSRLMTSIIPSYGPAGTFTGFDWEKMPDAIIDHIFVKGNLQVKRHGILTDNYGKKYPSDHFPVLAEITFL